MVMPTVSPTTTSAQPDPHVEWFVRVQRLLTERELVHDDAERDALTDEIGRLWRRIGSTMANTLAGARAQVECVAAQLTDRELELALANANATLDRLEAEGRVAFRYTGEVNGSARNLAGILKNAGNVLGMMPQPERALEDAHGNTDGRRLFEGLLEAVA